MKSYIITLPIATIEEWNQAKAGCLSLLQGDAAFRLLPKDHEFKLVIVCHHLDQIKKIIADTSSLSLTIAWRVLTTDDFRNSLHEYLIEQQHHIVIFHPYILYKFDLFTNLVMLPGDDAINLLLLPVIDGFWQVQNKSELSWDDVHHCLFKELSDKWTISSNLVQHPSGYGLRNNENCWIWRTTKVTPFFLHNELAVKLGMKILTVDAEFAFSICKAHFGSNSIRFFTTGESSHVFLLEKQESSDIRYNAHEQNFPFISDSAKSIISHVVYVITNYFSEFNLYSLMIPVFLKRDESNEDVNQTNICQEILFLQLILRIVEGKGGGLLRYKLPAISSETIELDLETDAYKPGKIQLSDFSNILLKKRLNSFRDVFGTSSVANIYSGIYKRLRAIIPKLKDKSKFPGRIIIYGAGTHTKTLLSLWHKMGGPDIYAIMVTGEPGKAVFEGLPVFSNEKFYPKFNDLILISSMSYEGEIADICKESFPDTSLLTIWHKSLSTFPIK